MKRWLTLSSALVLTAAMIGCAKGESGPVAINRIAGACHVLPTSVALQSSVSAESANQSQAQDPYLSRKVVFNAVGEMQTQAVSSPSEFSVTLKENCDLGGEISSAIGAKIASPSLATPSGVRSFIWQPSRAISFLELQSLAESDSCVVGISESVQATATEDAGTNLSSTALLSQLSDPLVSKQGHLTMLGASDAYQILGRLPMAGAPVTIAVIDTGIDMNHPDLNNVLWRNPGEIADNGIDDEGNGYIDDVYGYNFATGSGSPQYAGTWSGDQHGTHVSGLAAAQGGNGLGGSGVIGTDARIMMLNVFGPNKGANVSDTANAIRYAADNGANVINLSIGGSGPSATYESALAYAISKGVFIVAAAGNESKQLSTNFFEAPGSYAKEFKGMIAVASVDSSTNTLSTYSNYGPDYVKLASPGAENSHTGYGLLSTWPGGSYVRIQGTSMSSPVTAGAAAFAIMMMRQRGYLPSPGTIEALLETTAQKSTALNTYIDQGRVLSLSGLANFIDQNYSANGISGSAFDPGVPGVVGGCN